MNEVLKKSFSVAKEQWQLLLFTVIAAVVFQMDYGLGDENFGLIILFAIPYMFWCIYTFFLTKLIAQKMEHPKTSLVNSLKTYVDNAPKLILPMIGLTFLIIVAMTIIITMVYGFFTIFGISNTSSIFESGPRDLNYILFYLVGNIVMSFFSFQQVLYFLEKQPFFTALKNSLYVAKEHIIFTLLIGITYFVLMVIVDLIGSDVWYKNVINGVIDGVQYYILAIIFIIYYRKISKKQDY